MLKEWFWKQNRKQLLKDYKAKKTIVSGYPSHLKIELTNYCNLKCKICPSRIMCRPEGYMDFSLFKKIIDQTKNVEFIYHHFMGESLFNPHLFDMIRYTKSKGIRAGLSTNATKLDEENANKLIDSGLDFLVFSFDGGSKENYEQIRVNASYDQTLINITNFLRIVKEKKSKLIPVVQIINYDLDQKAIDDIYDTFSCGIMLKSAKDWAGSVKIKSGLQKDEDICLLPWIEMSVLWDGRVVPCANCFDSQNTLGDVSKQGLYEIWNGPAMQEFRKKHIENILENVDVCADCPRYKMKLEDFINQNQFETRIKTYNNRDKKVRKGLS